MYYSLEITQDKVDFINFIRDNINNHNISSKERMHYILLYTLANIEIETLCFFALPRFERDRGPFSRKDCRESIMNYIDECCKEISLRKRLREKYQSTTQPSLMTY